MELYRHPLDSRHVQPASGSSGFKIFEVKAIEVQADSSAHADATLTVGDVSQTVEVSGEAEQLKTDRAGRFH